MIPQDSYGVLQRTQCSSNTEELAEQITRLGYAVLDPHFLPDEVARLQAEFETVREIYTNRFSADKLESIGEQHTIRAPLFQSEVFLRLALNERLLSLLSSLIRGAFVLNQQNGIINPPKTGYNQGAWHRDFPYQHFTSSTPLGINALFCVDDFTIENGATYVLPASHLREPFPSAQFVDRNAQQVEAPAGSFIVLDCMVFHSGGYNQTDVERRAVNHLYTIPYFKQQIEIPSNLGDSASVEHRQVLGYSYSENRTIEEYLGKRG